MAGWDGTMQPSKSLEFRIPADTRYVSIVRRGVRNLAESMGFDREDVTDMEVAVSEAVTNSVTHGSPNADICGVVVKCCATGECLTVEVEDEGTATYIPLSSCECDPTGESGRGILMMRSLMDEFENSRTDHGMRIRMAKQKAAR